MNTIHQTDRATLVDCRHAAVSLWLLSNYFGKQQPLTYSGHLIGHVRHDNGRLKRISNLSRVSSASTGKLVRRTIACITDRFLMVTDAGFSSLVPLLVDQRCLITQILLWNRHQQSEQANWSGLFAAVLILEIGYLASLRKARVKRSMGNHFIQCSPTQIMFLKN